MIKIGEIEIPFDYFRLKQKDKEEIISEVYDSMYKVVDQMATPGYNRYDLLEQIIASSMITNTVEENYEICQLLLDIKKILDEKRN